MIAKYKAKPPPPLLRKVPQLERLALEGVVLSSRSPPTLGSQPPVACVRAVSLRAITSSSTTVDAFHALKDYVFCPNPQASLSVARPADILVFQ